ncbi:MAG: GntR family transcriptional regulator [Candidatus Accumulibacter necessarius]|uniref:GntR family transcriptional regulator n=1 Tax=Candidatus Accumulibacter necessarius TaxID=2954386 RepID=UPI002FC2FE58
MLVEAMESELLRYERLAEDLSGFIVAGNLRPGERLPSVRRLSRERRLSISTVLQALHQLEDRGLVEAGRSPGISFAMPRRGAPNPAPARPPRRRYRSMSASA